jgi:hypothetical protein
MQATEVRDVRHGNHDDTAYDAFLARVNARFLGNAQQGAAPIFTTDAEGLWQAYLDTFADADERQYHTCHACRTFVERFGGLVTIDEHGMTAPAVWHEDDAPEAYKPAVAAMARLARRAKVTGVFLSSDRVWGQPVTGIWHHLSVTPPDAMVFRRSTQTAGQAMAEKREDFKTVMTALNEFTPPMIEQAVTLLQTDSLYRSEKVLGQAEWLRDLHAARANTHGTAKANVVWRAIALAPAGFCHPRSSMIGTLLDDIAAGMDFDEVSRRFAAKMHPLRYQRPQAAPTAGAIAAAEKLVEQMGIARSLPRRFARLDEVRAIWTPKAEAEKPATGGVFGHLAPKGQDAPNMAVPPVTMTWDKFQRTVLPSAEKIEYFTNHGTDSFTSLVTAVNEDAPPILQWDREDARNPVSWYFWHGGSTASSFSLAAGKFHRVAAVALKPSMWGDGGFEHQGQGVLFVIEGAKDQRTPTACLFPEILKSELHGVRSVIEAYSLREQMQGAEQASAAGVMLQKGSNWDARLRVTSAGRSVEYRLDRWD